MSTTTIDKQEAPGLDDSDAWTIHGPGDTTVWVSRTGKHYTVVGGTWTDDGYRHSAGVAWLGDLFFADLDVPAAALVQGF